jgi:hypothetical protein
MLVIGAKQMRALEVAAQQRFENELLDDLESVFARQFRWLGRDGMAKVARLGIGRAARHGLDSDRDIFVYVTLMLLLGSYFDEDPQLPWAAAELDRHAPPVLRLESLYEAAMDYLDRVAGEENEHLIRAVARARKVDIQMFDHVRREKLPGELTAWLGRLYPEKWSCQGEAATRAVAERAVAAAADHRLRQPAGAVLLAALAFMTGAGFARDPQLPWAAETLAGNLAPAEKLDKLNQQAMAFADFGLS